MIVKKKKKKKKHWIKKVFFWSYSVYILNSVLLYPTQIIVYVSQYVNSTNIKLN